MLKRELTDIERKALGEASPEERDEFYRRRSEELVSPIKEQLADLLNSFDHTDAETLVDLLTNRMHRTLQQTLFGYVVCGLIKAFAEKEENNYDARNEFSVKTARKLLAVLKEEYVVSPDGKLSVPCI